MRWHTVNSFMVVLAIHCLGKGMFYGYTVSQLTTMEKRFFLSSHSSGFLISCYEIGYLLTILIGSYIGSRYHLPKSIAITSGILGFAMILYTSPQILFPSSSFQRQHVNASVREQFLNRNELCDPLRIVLISNTTLGPEISLCNTQKTSKDGAYVMLVTFMVIIGSMASIGSPLGGAYVANNVDPRRDSLYQALIIAMFAGGNILGYSLGSLTATIYEIPWQDPGYTSSDARWISAWWIGPLVCALQEIVCAFPLYSFPQHIRKTDIDLDPCENERSADDRPTRSRKRPKFSLEAGDDIIDDKEVDLQADRPSGIDLGNGDVQLEELGLSETPSTTSSQVPFLRQNTSLTVAPVTCDEFVSEAPKTLRKGVSHFLAALKRILTNPIFLLITGAGCSTGAMISGYLTFIPKYYEEHFGRPTSEANIMAGFAAIAGTVGAVIGGAIGTYFKFRPKKKAGYVLGATLVANVPIVLQYFLVCQPTAIDGIPLSFPTISSQQMEIPLNMREYRARDLTRQLNSGDYFILARRSCNSNCSCTRKRYNPVCDTGRSLSYLSACYAGCVLPKNRDGLYRNCTCLDLMDLAQENTNAKDNGEIGGIREGKCPRYCSTYWLFVTCMLLTGIVGTSTIGILQALLLESCQEEDRAAAIGLQLGLHSVVGYLQGPIIFGAIFDRACILKQSNECGLEYCVLYNHDKLRRSYNGAAILFTWTSLALIIALVYFAHKLQDRQDYEKLVKEHSTNRIENVDTKITDRPVQESGL